MKGFFGGEVGVVSSILSEKLEVRALEENRKGSLNLKSEVMMSPRDAQEND